MGLMKCRMEMMEKNRNKRKERKLGKRRRRNKKKKMMMMNTGKRWMRYLVFVQQRSKNIRQSAVPWILKDAFLWVDQMRNWIPVRKKIWPFRFWCVEQLSSGRNPATAAGKVVGTCRYVASDSPRADR